MKQSLISVSMYKRIQNVCYGIDKLSDSQNDLNHRNIVTIHFRIVTYIIRLRAGRAL